MDESAQQAVQLGVNVTIFVIALSISITLLLGVRDVAELAFEYDASIPTGSRVVSAKEMNKRIISGDELLSYYATYMTDINIERIGRYVIKIVNGEQTLEQDSRMISEGDEPTYISNLKAYLTNELGNDVFAKDYEVITERYDKNDERLEITLKAI